MSRKTCPAVLATTVLTLMVCVRPSSAQDLISPDGLPNPEYQGFYAWYRADAGAMSGKKPAGDGAPVTMWMDSTVNGRNLIRTSTDPARQPVFASDFAGSGMPSLEFDGNDYIWANQTAEFGEISTARTIFLVARPDIINGGYIFDSCTHYGRNAMFAGQFATRDDWGAITGTGTIECGPAEAGKLTTISMMLADGFQSIVINAGDPTTGDLSLQNLPGFIVGSRYTTTNGLTGGIHEILVYKEALDPDDVARITLYLDLKYRLIDCNENGVHDLQEILDGTAIDCNENNIPDECDLRDSVELVTDRTPVEPSDFIEFDVSAMSDAADAVTLEVSAVGDLASTSEFMFVYLEDSQIGLAFVATGSACSPVMDTFSIPAADWNAAGADGTRLIRISGVNIAPDACAEPSTSIRVVVPQPITDCDGNGTWDACDISSGEAADLDGNGVPDSCDPDCDGDGEPDGYEILSGQDLDCNGNLVPDGCDVAGGSSTDVDSDGVPDECQVDCNENGLPDAYEIANGLEDDCNNNEIPDSCDIAEIGEPDCDGDGIIDFCAIADGTAMDCNANGHPDNCDIAEGTSNDVDSNGTPDECKDDCNGNGIPDYWEILKGQVEDCDGNGIPDACDIAAGTLADCDLDGRWDECAIDDGSVTDCNGNRVPDTCDIEGGTDEDDNGNGTPDACEIALGDLNLDGCIDAGDLGLLIALWGLQNPPFGDLNGDGTISAADLGLLIGNWTPGCP